MAPLKSTASRGGPEIKIFPITDGFVQSLLRSNKSISTITPSECSFSVKMSQIVILKPSFEIIKGWFDRNSSPPTYEHQDLYYSLQLEFKDYD